MGKNIGQYIRKNLSGKFSQKLVDHAKQFATDIVKTTSKILIQNTAEAAGDSIGNKIADKTTKIINLSDDTPNQPSKFKTKNCAEINDKLQGTYNEDNEIRFKTSMLRSILCDYSDVYILVKGTLTVAPATTTAPNNKTAANKKVIFKNCATFNNCIRRINNTQVDDARDIDIVIPMNDLIEYSDNYLKKPWNLLQYCIDEPAVNVANGDLVGFNADNATTNSFKINEKITI